MLDVIEKLLILQDRDRKISRVKAELNNIGPERQALQAKAAAAQAQLDAVKLKLKQVETERNKLELEVESKKQQIQKYSVQQFQTKKNEEYRALANEIENCKGVITQLDDQQILLMERAEEVQKEIAIAMAAAGEIKKLVDGQLGELANREEALKKQLSELLATHDQLKAQVEEGVLDRYQRLRKTKGDNPLVGIEHSVCGGCHVRLPMQVVLSCQAQQEIVNCPNCGRILYYTPHMDLVGAD